MFQAPILTSRNIGETENALRAILIKTLSGTGLDYPRWVALQLVSLSQSALSVDEVLAQLTGGLKIDETSARDARADLENRDILQIVGDRFSTTPRGVALFQRVRDQIRPITDRLYAGLRNEDLAVAHRVLATILERANAILMDWSSLHTPKFSGERPG